MHAVFTVTITPGWWRGSLVVRQASQVGRISAMVTSFGFGGLEADFTLPFVAGWMGVSDLGGAMVPPAPLHSKDLVQLVRPSVKWHPSPPPGQAPLRVCQAFFMSTPEQTPNTLDRLGLQAGMGTPRLPPQNGAWKIWAKYIFLPLQTQ